MEETRPVELLLVEDNPGDVLLTTECLRDCGTRNRLHVVADGQEALSFVRRQGRYADAPRPDLVLLDLNLPRLGGREVLAEMKGDNALRCIPVVIFSSSTADRDVMAAYRLHANSYVTKPAEYDALVQVMKSIELFWLASARLPPARR